MDKILCAAIHFEDGIKHDHQPKNIKTGFVLTGRRHHNCFMSLKITSNGTIKPGQFKDTQGFLTEKDIFLNREQAFKLAKLNGQLRKKYQKEGQLFSEDLY